MAPSTTLTCRHFGSCGGCSALLTPIRDQLEGKVARLRERVGPFLGEVEIAWAVPDRTPRHYRTKLLYPVRADRKGLAVLGIYARGTHDVVRIEQCETQDPGLTEFGMRAERVLRELRLPPFDEVTERGFVRALHARVAPGTGELLIGVVTRPGEFAAGPELAARLRDAAEGLPHPGTAGMHAVGVVRSISDRPGNFLLGRRHVPLWGRDYHEDRQDKLTFRIGFGSFYQVHRAASTLLYRPALALCGDVRNRTVVDGYGGVGTFALRFAQAGAARVLLVEDSPVACRDAEHNARKNGLAQVVVARAKFADAELPRGVDLVLVDPPRSGLLEAGAKRVLEARPGRILHVACSADALARDLAALTGGGYGVRAMQLCDLFPHTEHVEVLTRLEPVA
jgi:23S rRNA (uracil1939-C5)-methyltransferase